MNKGLTMGKQLEQLIELLKKREKEKPSPIWLTVPRKNNDSEEK